MGNPADRSRRSVTVPPRSSFQPADATTPWNEPAAVMSAGVSPHEVEQEVQRRLMTEPGCRFSSLVVRRINGGVCLEGVVESGLCRDGIRDLVRQIDGVDEVLNHLVDCRS